MILHMRHAEPYQIPIGDLYEISVIGQAPSLDLLLQLLDKFIIGVQLIHIVMREGEFSLEVAIVVKHVVFK